MYRVYRLLKLNLRRKPKKRLIREQFELLAVPAGSNGGSLRMDLSHGQLSDARTYRLFNVTDDYNREELILDEDLLLPAQRVMPSLEQVISINYIQPGTPQQNAYLEPYNRIILYN